MHIYSFVLIGLFIYNITRKASYKSKLVFQTTVTAWVYIFTNRGYFFESDILNVDYWQAAIIFEFALLLSGGRISKISKRMAAFLLCLTVSMGSVAILPATQAQVVGNAGSYEYFMAGVQQYIKPEFTKFTIFLYALAVIQAFVFDGVYKSFGLEETKKVVLNLAKLSKIVVGIGVVELVIKNILQSNIYNDMMVIIFGRGSSAYTRLVQRGSVFMLTGLSREGSQYAFALGIAIVLLFASQKCAKRQCTNLWIAVAMVLMVFSGAFTLVISILMLLAFYAVYYVNKNEGGKKKVGRIVGISFAALILIVAGVLIYDRFMTSDNYISARLSSALATLGTVFSRDASYYTMLATIDSTTTRLYSIVHTLSNWIYRPLFGLGEGSTYCHGCAALTIAEIGLLGTYTYLRFYFGRYLEDKHFGRIARPLLIIWFVVSMISGGSPRMYIGLDGVTIMMSAYVVFSAEGSNNDYSRKINELVSGKEA